MKGDKRFRYIASSALSPLQRDFVKPRPAKVKQLIRLVKYWKGTCLQVFYYEGRIYQKKIGIL